MNKEYFHGIGKHYPYFEGWYLKHQSKGRTIAFIPAVHADARGRWTASIQVIEDHGAWNFEYPIEACKINRSHFYVNIGGNIFSEKGISVDLSGGKPISGNRHSQGARIRGKLRFGEFHGINGDIMGFFRFFPFLQCSHGILSMSHSLAGSLEINGEKAVFSGGYGYVESDWGESFPRTYLWSQCGFGAACQNSIMAAVADVPILGVPLKGCICAIHYRGREYRLATYRGGRILDYGKGVMTVRQDKYMLRICRTEEKGFALHAPHRGVMSRMIKENPACPVRYQLWENGKEIFDFISSQASFEQVI